MAVISSISLIFVCTSSKLSKAPSTFNPNINTTPPYLSWSNSKRGIIGACALSARTYNAETQGYDARIRNHFVNLFDLHKWRNLKYMTKHMLFIHFIYYVCNVCEVLYAEVVAYSQSPTHATVKQYKLTITNQVVNMCSYAHV